VSTSPVHTPSLQEKKSAKRNREEVSPMETNIINSGFKLKYRKKEKHSSRLNLNKDSEQQQPNTSKEIPETTLGEEKSTDPPDTSTPSQDQQLQITQKEAYLSSEPEKSTMDIYKEIKLNNESLKINIYNQFWKQTSSTQSRLLTAFDSEKGRMNMAFLQAQVP